MLYLKTVNHRDKVVAMTPIGEAYTLHKPGSDYFDHYSEEEADGEMTGLTHIGILSFDDPSSEGRRGLISLRAGADHFIIHENGGTFQRL